MNSNQPWIKFIIGTIVALTLFNSKLYADNTEELVGSLQYSQYNEFADSYMNKSLTVCHDGENEKTALYWNQFPRFAAVMDDADREGLVELLKKFLEWEKKAITKQVKIKKDIGTLEFLLGFVSDEKWHISPAKVPVSFTFFSVDKDSHELLITFDKIQSRQNEFLSHTPEKMFIDSKNVSLLVKYLSDTEIQKALKKYQKRKENEEDFK